MEKPEISIIVPVYNVEEYLAECLDSILAQDFEHYEIICVDDCSTDNSGKILQTYASAHQQIRVFIHEKNRGLSAARNTGMLHTKGEYIWFVDSDDMIAPKSLAVLYNAAEENGADIVYFNMSVFYEDRGLYGKHIPVLKHKYAGIHTGKELFCQYIENKDLKIEAWRQFVRTTFIRNTGIEFYEGIIHEDNLFSFLCAMKAGRVIDIDQQLYIYRQRKNSIMGNMDGKHAQSTFVVMVQILAYWASHEFQESEHKAIGFYFEQVYRAFAYYRCYENGKSALELGGNLEKELYALLKRAGKPRLLTLSGEQIEQVRRAAHVIIFGAGKGAMEIFHLLKRNNIAVDLFAVSEPNNNAQFFCGAKVDTIDNISHYMPDALVVIGITAKYCAGIQDKLGQLGYTNVVMPISVLETNR